MDKRQTYKDVLRLALPAVGEMTLFMLIWVFDTMIVGQYGGNLLVTSVSLSSQVISTFENIFIGVGLAVGMTSIVARKIGAKLHDDAEEFSSLGIMIATIIALITSAIFFMFAEPILIGAKADANVLKYGTNYMRICSIGLFFSMITTSLNSILRGYGNTKTPLLVTTVVTIVNLSLDILLVFGLLGFPELGANGAAIATTTAKIIGFLCILIYMMKKSPIKPRLKYVKSFNHKRLKELLILAIPSGLQEAAFSISRLINTFMIMSLGSVAFSANSITTTIESISFNPGWGFAVAATALVGQAIGEKNYKKAKDYGQASLVLGCIVMGVFSLMFLFIPNTLVSMFITESEIEVIKLGTTCVMIAAVEQIPMAISMIVGGALKGIGDTKTPFIVSFFTSWCVRLPLMFLAISVLKLPVTAVWWITGIQWLLDGALIYVQYKKRFRNLQH